MPDTQVAFGPVPSRRLGRSLGINNIPPKICTYSCVYCQLGPTHRMKAGRQAFYEPEAIFHAVKEKVGQARVAGAAIDYLTFVPDGEPTLDMHLGRTIELLRPLGIPIAVITNASLIGCADVRAELCTADWVSLKLDTVDEAVWHQVDRPYGSLTLEAILDGALEFSGAFSGKLVTETMLVAGLNDGPAQVEPVADFVARLEPATAYLAIPTRPPAEEWVQAPPVEVINRAYQIFKSRIEQTEYLIDYEGSTFSLTSDVAQDLLGITAVHPMREDAVRDFLARADADWSVIATLIAQGDLVAVEYGGRRYFLRQFRSGHSATSLHT
jgi:wyosine [tRNA(Phe)-imidazoG37] synthetase (radical SAM superfamily)